MSTTSRRGGLRRALIAGTLALASLLALISSPMASAAPRTTNLLVTIAARTCPSYTSITANRARNDIQESLRDLGANTPYRAGQAIDPKVEADNQPDCEPLPEWAFTLGTGIKTRAVSGPWGSLSIVTNPYATDILTQGSVPLLNPDGGPTGKEIAGATTIELTDAQADRASRPSSLWIQGGTPTDPILDQIYPGQYGFGALRCSIDNLNGDNVEWISYPVSTRHVFCFAYYVKPPPTSGTIVIRKETHDAQNAQTFQYDGNLSFSPDGRFNLTASDSKPGEASFYRAETLPGDAPWRVRELVPSNFEVESIDCTSKTGGSTTDTNRAEGRASIDLAAGDTVRCTYVDRRIPDPGSLTILKQSFGDVGSFDFRIDGDGASRDAEATTQEEGVEVVADPTPVDLKPGDYEITEKLPDSAGGRWRLTGVECNGEERDPGEPIKVQIGERSQVVCTFTDRFTPRGSITIDKITLGATGTAGFSINPIAHPDLELLKSATTKRPGEPARATGDQTDALPLGNYVIQETSPTDTNGYWSLAGVECDGKPEPFEGGEIKLTLTRNKPDRHCTFTNQFEGKVKPPDPGPVDPKADLALTKRVRPKTIAAGDVVKYTLEARNLGPDRAEDVVVSEIDEVRGAKLISIRSDRGTCSTNPAPRCDLGALDPDESATITARVRLDRPGTTRNVAAIGSAIEDPNLANNTASASVEVAGGEIASEVGGGQAQCKGVAKRC